MIKQSLATVQGQIEPADLLLFRGGGWISNAISTAGRSHYTHAAGVDVWDGELYCCEVREFKGGRVVTLASQVELFPGRIDVYKTNPSNNPNYNRQAAALYMRRFAGCSYGYWSVALAALLHIPMVRLFYKPDYTIEVNEPLGPKKPPYCSQAKSMADRLGGGVDTVPNLPDRLTEPADLSRSPFYSYMFTLVS